MEPRKLTKEDIDKVRHIDGFPIAKDEDIIGLSNAPYYTACPNPFIEDFIKEYGKPYNEEKDDYHREPFAADVSEGKSDAIYNAHMYHTKVPYKAIMRYILHYTNPNDIVLDGFSGTGMTGVAAHMCAHPESVFKAQLEKEMPYIEWGQRNTILNDLSPAATFISRNYNSKLDVEKFEKEARQILSESQTECAWMFETNHVAENDICFENIKTTGIINYTVWSDILICPNCGDELVFWEVASDKSTGKVNDEFHCTQCNTKLKKSDCEKAMELVLNESSNETVKMIKQIPVLINYQYGKKRYFKEPDNNDLETIRRIKDLRIPYWYPTQRMCEGRESRRNDKIGLTHVHHYFFKRTLYVLAKMFSLIEKSENESILKIMFTSQIINISKLNRYRPQVSFPYNPLSGTLYVSSMICEANPFNAYEGKVKKFSEALKYNTVNNCSISTGSTTSLCIPEDSCDYIFTDPPFGDNLNYSELSFLWEAWLKVVTNSLSEAIVNTSMGKSLLDYQHLMTKCFKEYYRVLKPNRWMTVEFHNSKNAVWNAIQESLQHAGFVVADVRTLDKQSGSFKQVTSSGAVKQDLIISAYKPRESFRREFISKAGSEDTAWAFVNQHLDNLPVTVVKFDRLELISERQPYLLYDRMVAYHVMNGIPIPLDAVDFYKGLDDRFLKRDGMYFLPDQVNEYDTARITNDVEPIQFELFVTNEKSAIAWLYQQLDNPQSYSELQPKFMQEIKAWDKFEERPELGTLLEENFLQNEEGKWYVPDVTKVADVIKLREKKLLKEFEGYLASKGKLKLFRAEAVRVGFAKLWTDKNYKLIVETADRLPESVIQEDDKLLMYYDISLGRI
jgi:DNA modification methylase